MAKPIPDGTRTATAITLAALEHNFDNLTSILTTLDPDEKDDLILTLAVHAARWFTKAHGSHEEAVSMLRNALDQLAGTSEFPNLD